MDVEINIEEIQEFLPHRYPMLLVDRVIDMVLGESITAYKNITTNELFFMGHFISLQQVLRSKKWRRIIYLSEF